MANGRMITNLICRDKRVNQLSSDTGRLAFTWLITFADCEGRAPGDPAVVRSMLFPRRQDVTIEQMEGIIREWSAVGLAVWYEAQDDKWIWFPGFDKNQSGLRKDREAPSKIPPPPEQAPDDNINEASSLLSSSGQAPDQIQVKLKEVKLKEVEAAAATSPEFASLCNVYEKNIGPLTPGISETLQADLDTYGLQNCMDAITEALKNNVRKWAYVQSILRRWKNEGRDKPKPGTPPPPRTRKVLDVRGNVIAEVPL